MQIITFDIDFVHGPDVHQTPRDIEDRLESLDQTAVFLAFMKIDPIARNKILDIAAGIENIPPGERKNWKGQVTENSEAFKPLLPVIHNAVGRYFAETVQQIIAASAARV